MVDRDQLIKEIYELFAYSIELLKKKDPVGLANRFIINGQMKRSNAPIVKGRKNIEKVYARLITQPDLQITASDLEIHLDNSGLTATVLSSYTSQHGTDNGIVKDEGKRLMFLVREKGKWWIGIEMLSSNG